MTEAAAIAERPPRKPRTKRQPPTGREICRQAGVSHGLLRHYFQKPDNLLFGR